RAEEGMELAVYLKSLRRVIIRPPSDRQRLVDAPADGPVAVPFVVQETLLSAGKTVFDLPGGDHRRRNHDPVFKIMFDPELVVLFHTVIGDAVRNQGWKGIFPRRGACLKIDQGPAVVKVG